VCERWASPDGPRSFPEAIGRFSSDSMTHVNIVFSGPIGDPRCATGSLCVARPGRTAEIAHFNTARNRQFLVLQFRTAGCRWKPLIRDIASSRAGGPISMPRSGIWGPDHILVQDQETHLDTSSERRKTRPQRVSRSHTLGAYGIHCAILNSHNIPEWRAAVNC
jgi:hypothetical protein